MGEIFGDYRGVLIGRRRRPVLGKKIDAGLVAPLIKRDLQPAGHQALLHVAAPAATGADADQIDRAMADIVVAVAAEILCREFPVARDPPFLDAAQYLGATLAAVPAVQGQIEISDEFAEIFEKGRRIGIPAGPDGALVAAELRDLDQSPLRFVELLVVGLAEIGHADEPAVGAVAPAVVGAGEDRGVALVVAAHLLAAVPAGIEEHVGLARPVAAQDHRLLAHARDEVVARVGDLALMPDKEPHPGEEPLQLPLVDLLVDEDLAADPPGRYVPQTRPIARFTRARP